jgi:hypothetical protein
MFARFADLAVLGQVWRPIAGDRREAAAAAAQWGNELDKQGPFNSLRISRTVDALIETDIVRVVHPRHHRKPNRVTRPVLLGARIAAMS